MMPNRASSQTQSNQTDREGGAMPIVGDARYLSGRSHRAPYSHHRPPTADEENEPAAFAENMKALLA